MRRSASAAMDFPPSPNESPPEGGAIRAAFSHEEGPPGIGAWLARQSEAIESLRHQQESSFDKLHDLLSKRLDARRIPAWADDIRSRSCSFVGQHDPIPPFIPRSRSPPPSERDIADIRACLDAASSPVQASQDGQEVLPNVRRAASAPVGMPLAHKLPRFKESMPMALHSPTAAASSPTEAGQERQEIRTPESTQSAPAGLMLELTPMSPRGQQKMNRQLDKVAAYMSKPPRDRRSSSSTLERSNSRFEAPPARPRGGTLGNVLADVQGVGAQMDVESGKSAHDWASFVRTRYFDHVCSVCLTLNAVFIGIQVQCQYGEGSTPTVLNIVDYAFCLCFIAELVLRLVYYGARRYFWGVDWHWNWFDFIVVSLSAFDVALNLVVWDSNTPMRSLSVIRIFRILRMTRVLRIIRALAFFKPLRILIAAIVSTLKTAIWACLLLCIVMYMFGIAISQCVAEYIHDVNTPENFDHAYELNRYFGSVPKSIFTILMAVLGGVSWEVAIDPLAGVGWAVAGLFVMCIAFLMLCVMNVLVGIFCEHAIETSRNDKENLIQFQLSEKQRYVRELQNIFSKWNACSCNGGIDFEQFQLHMNDPYVQALFKSMEIESHDAWTLFMLLDRDGEGTVDLDEFIEGCIRLRGSAKALHLSQIEYSNRWLMNKTADILEAMQAIDDRLRLSSDNGKGALSEAGSEAITKRRASDICPEEPARVKRIEVMPESSTTRCPEMWAEGAAKVTQAPPHKLCL